MGSAIVIGAGPAGASLAFLLARAGIETTLIERRTDFSREFRGEVLMPSGVQALKQMGLGELLTSVPNRTIPEISAYMNGRQLFSETLSKAIFNGDLPLAISQPAMLETLVNLAARNSTFSFRQGVSISELIVESDRVRGVRLRTAEQDDVFRADLVIGADGRNSVVRRSLQLATTHSAPPMDVVWCKLPCPEDWRGARAYLGRGHLLLAYQTWDDSLQLGWVILKNTFGKLRERGIEAWVGEMARHVSDDLAAHLNKHIDAIRRPFLLEAVSDRVRPWSAPGAVLIGDAAHTMSPVAAQGINVALRDSIVAANHLIEPLLAPQPDQRMIDAATIAFEAERLPELETLQKMQNQPPKLVLSRAFWGEPLRRIAGLLLSRPGVRVRMAQQVAPFAFGVSDVQLQASVNEDPAEQNSGADSP
jgi:2-polyprenyl-6-methoxyphenol hydroxylase-like FAD-dependent oxidoreductase